MKNHRTLILVTALAMSALVVLAATPAQKIKAQLTGNNAIARYSQGLVNNLNLCKDNPFRSHDIPAIVIPGNASGKNGGITAFGNANATEHGKNGPISIGGGYNDKSSSASPYNGNLGSRGGNGGIAFCGSANGQNLTKNGS